MSAGIDVDALLARGRARKAVRVATQEAADAPDDIQLQLRLARTHELAGSRHAAALYDAVLAHQPGSTEAALGLARAHARSGDAAHALGILEELPVGARAGADGLAARALALAAVPDPDGARDALAAARALAANRDLTAIELELHARVDPLHGLAALAPRLADAPLAGSLVAHAALERLIEGGRQDVAVSFLHALPAIPDSVPVTALIAELALWYVSDAADGAAAMSDLVEYLDNDTRAPLWGDVAKRFVRLGRFDEARWLVASDARTPEKLGGILDALPGVSRTRAVGREDWELRVDRAPGEATRTVVVFALGGFLARVLDEQLYDRPVHVVHVGVTAESSTLLAAFPTATFAAAAEQLRTVVDELGLPTIAIAASAAGYAALRYSLAIGCESALLLAPLTTLDQTDEGLNRYTSRAELDGLAADMKADPSGSLRPFVDANAGRTRIEIYYPEASADDRAHAALLDGAPGVRLHGRPGQSGHKLLMPMIEDGTFATALGDLIAGA